MYRTHQQNAKAKQIIKGKVTEVNWSLLYFEVREFYRFYIDIHKTALEMPYVNDYVEITSPVKYYPKTSTGIIGQETKCCFPHVNKVSTRTESKLLKFLQENHIDDDEIIAMDIVLRKLQQIESETDFLIGSLQKIFSEAPFMTKCNGLKEENKQTFKKVEIKLPRDLNFVNKTSELYSFMQFNGMCSFGVHPSRSLEVVTDSFTEILYGILDVDLQCGIFVLKDVESKVPVKFTNTKYDLFNFKNCLVEIKKWTVFTEMFEDETIESLKYILLNPEYISVVKSLDTNSNLRFFYKENEEVAKGHRKSMFLHVLKKSDAIFGYSNKTECWIEATISETDSSLNMGRSVYLVLSHGHMAIVPFLKEGFIYKVLYLNEEVKPVKINSYPELFGLRASKQVFLINGDTIFQETRLVCSHTKPVVLDSFEEVKKYISSNQDGKYFSVCLQIHKKTLQDNLQFPSRYPRRHQNIPSFGIAGVHKQMNLVFMDSTSNSFIDLYLPNRENHLTPLGLLQGMKVKITHVQSHKNKYIKTSVFSSFEVQEYCAPVNFSSVTLSFKNFSTWNWHNKSPKTLLGMHHFVPLGCIVQGSFLLQAVFDLRITPICVNGQSDIRVEITVLAQDSINPSFYVNTDNNNFLYDLLGINRELEVKHFCNAFSKIGKLDIDLCKAGNFDYIKDEESKMFIEELFDLIKNHINFKLYSMVDAVCLKQKTSGAKPWKMIDFSFVE